MRYKDRVLKFASGDKHIKVHSNVLREDIIFAGRAAKVESKRFAVYRGAEIMILLKALRQGTTSEEFRKIHAIKRCFDGTMRYSEQDEKLHKITLRAEATREQRHHPPKQTWAQRMREQHRPAAPRNPGTGTRTIRTGSPRP